MKDFKEILFDHYRQDKNGIFLLPLKDCDILDAMEQAAIEVLSEYIMKRNGCASKFEAIREATRFISEQTLITKP